MNGRAKTCIKTLRLEAKAVNTPAILDTEDLKRLTKLERPGDIERVLSRQGIKVFRGRHGSIFTTIDLVNHAGGLHAAGNREDIYDPESIIG